MNNSHKKEKIINIDCSKVELAVVTELLKRYSDGHMVRKETDRFKFDYEYYDGTNGRMLHIRIYGESAMQTDLWLNEDDQQKLKEILNLKEEN